MATRRQRRSPSGGGYQQWDPNIATWVAIAASDYDQRYDVDSVPSDASDSSSYDSGSTPDSSSGSDYGSSGSSSDYGSSGSDYGGGGDSGGGFGGE